MIKKPSMYRLMSIRLCSDATIDYLREVLPELGEMAVNHDVERDCEVLSTVGMEYSIDIKDGDSVIEMAKRLQRLIEGERE